MNDLGVALVWCAVQVTLVAALALVLDAALRVGAMYAVPGSNDLYVPVRMGRILVPVGPRASSFSAAPREIRATTPRVENGRVLCDRSEVLDESGFSRIVVADALATPLGNSGLESRKTEGTNRVEIA